jgi:hypothetical protein
MLTMENESYSDEGLTVNVNQAAASYSVTGGWDGDINDFFAIDDMPEDMFDALGAVQGSLLVNLDFDVEASTSSSWEGPPFKSIIWHHTNNLSIENENVQIDYDDSTEEVSVSGTTTVKASCLSSLGFTLSNETNGWNGKFIVKVEMEEVDEEGIALAALQDALEPEIMDGDAAGIKNVISDFFFNGVDNFLTITITAYQNNGAEIGSAVFDPFAFIPEARG